MKAAGVGWGLGAAALWLWVASPRATADDAVPAFVPVPIAAQADRAFRDEVAGDGKGGWTDQGPDNDLAALKPGPLAAAGISFNVADPDAQGGRAVLALSRTAERKVAAAATVPVAGGPVWRSLYLLHAAAWLSGPGAAVGEVKIRYADGTEEARTVVSGTDVGNWWMPANLPNGAVGWKGENASSPVGLYVSRFPLQPKPVEAVTLSASGSALWLVAGLSGSPGDQAPSSPAVPLVTAAGGEWFPYDHSVEIEKDGPFDFSRLNEAPAGKYGPVTATPEGHFAFRNRMEARVRFWGVSLVTEANFLEHDEADRVAERLGRSGYNLVRLHSFDNALANGPAPGLDPAKLDRLDFLFAALKRRGIYAVTDLFVLRGFNADALRSMGLDPGMNRGDSRPRFKALLPVSEPAMALWEAYARDFLTHRNPYTGLTWAEDPALAGICLVNENLVTASTLDAYPEIRALYEAAFAAWSDPAPNPREAKADRYNRFLVDVQAGADERMRRFLRGLGVQAPLTGDSNKATQEEAFLRERFDYVDNHEYWDHPQFPQKRWALPFAYAQTSCVRYGARLLRRLMPTRVLGKPFLVTEFNFVRPNSYRAEGGVLMPAYAGLQDWDGLLDYMYADNREIATRGAPDKLGIFSIASDPVNLLADRVSALVFRRGDISPAPGLIAYAVEPAWAYRSREREFPDAFAQLGLVTRIGSRTGDPKDISARKSLSAVVVDPAEAGSGSLFPAGPGLAAMLQQRGVIPPGSIDPDKRRFVSETGQIELDAGKGTLKVTTPLSELFVLPPGQTLQGAAATVRNGSAFGTVSIVSLDDRPLPQSGRLLVVHLTDAEQSGMRFADQDRRLLEARGDAPLLVREGKATLHVKRAAGLSCKAWALDAAGARLREVPLRSVDDGVDLEVEAAGPDGALAYEIAAK